MQQRDFLERLIQQIAAFIAKVLGLVKSGQIEEAEQELDNAWSAIGFRRNDAHRLDDATLTMMLGAKVSLAVQLFEAEAAILEARGSLPLAEMLRERAAKLSKPARPA